MVRAWVISVCILQSLYAEPTIAVDLLERHCVSCHKDLPTSLQRMFMRYLLVYGGEKNVKAGLKHYLQYPSRDISVMSTLFIEGYGVKEKSKLEEETLEKVIDVYWDKFQVIGKLK